MYGERDLRFLNYGNFGVIWLPIFSSVFLVIEIFGSMMLAE
jgi:hypothetical protein